MDRREFLATAAAASALPVAGCAALDDSRTVDLSAASPRSENSRAEGATAVELQRR